MKLWFSRFKSLRLSRLPWQSSNAQLRAMFGAITDVILVIDASGRYVQIAPTNTALLYRPAEELLGKTFHHFFSREQADEFLEVVRRVLASRRTVALEYQMTIGSRALWFEAKVSPLRADAVVWVAHDITAQKQRERELATVNTIGRALAESLDLNQICEQLAAAIGQIFPDYLSLLIALYDSHCQMMKLIFGLDDSGRLDTAQFPPLPLEPPGYGPQSEAIHTRRAVVVNNYPERLRRTQRQVTVGEVPQAVLYAPMLAKGEVIGVVQVQSKMLDRFSQEDAELLAFIANTAAVSIANARLFEAEREQRAVTEALHDTLVALSGTLNLDEVLDLTLRNVGRIVPNDAAGIVMIDQGMGRIVRWQGRMEPGQEHLVYSLELPVDRTPHLHRMINTGRASIIPDAHADPDWIKFPATAWIRAHCAAPIRAHGRVIGVLEAHCATPDVYTSDHLSRLQALADQAGIAVQNVQLFDAEQEQHALSEALYDTAAALNSTLDFDEVLDRVLRNVGRIVPNDAANIAVLEEGVARSARWLGYVDDKALPRAQDLRWKLDEVPSLRRLVESRQPQLIADTYHDPQWIHVPATRWIRSYVAAPIEHKGRILGVLELSSSQPNFFTPKHASHLHLFAAQAAAAVENARLFDQTQRRVQELGILYESSVAINSSLDRSTVLKTIAQRLAEAVNATSAYVIWLDWEQLTGAVFVEFFTSRASEQERLSHLGESFRLTDSPRLLQALRQGQPSLEALDHSDTDPFMIAELKRFGGKSSLRVPMAVSGQVRGYFAIWDSQTERAWSEAEIRLCQTLANQAGVAILNAQLFEEAQRQAVEQAALFAAARAVSSSLDLMVVLQRLAEQLVRAVNLTSAYIGDWNPRAETTTVLAECLGPEARPEETVSDLGHTYLISEMLGEPYDWLIDSGTAIMHIDDESTPAAVREHLRQYGGQSVLIVALAAHDTVFGYAEMWESRRKRKFTPAEISLCQSIAQQAAIAFENARLFEAERKQLRLAQTLQAVGALLTAEMSLAEVFEQLFDLLAQVVRYDSVSIQLVEGDRAQLVAGRGFSDMDRLSKDINLITRLTLEERWGEQHERLVVIPDTYHDPRWIITEAGPYVRSWIGAALRVKGRLLGILNVDSEVVNEYDEALGETVAAFANQAAIAIENAQLHDADRRHADDLERRVQQRTAELERERKRTEAILHAAGEGIMMTDVEGHIEYMNPAMERLTGYTLAEALGKLPSLWQSQRTPAALYEKLWGTIGRGAIWRGELVNRRRDGSLYDAALTIAPLQDFDGEIIGYVGVQRDVTEQKELDRLKNEFVSNVSHELRTPIANVKLYITLLTRGKPEKYEDYLQTLRREAARLEKLIEDLLDLSRLDLGTTQLVLNSTDLNQLAAQLIADRTALAAQHHLVVDYHSDSNMPLVQADEAKLVQVMSNLLTNAINYTPPGGQITVSTVLRDLQGEHWGTFTVQDTGPGISPQDLPHLFERFYRGAAGRKSGAPGTGLGLAISRQIMDRMGGYITAESEPGQGAAFTVWCKST